MTRPRYERRDGVEIEGASPKQREALELVLAGIPSTRIEALPVRDFELDEGGDLTDRYPSHTPFSATGSARSSS